MRVHLLSMTILPRLSGEHNGFEPTQKAQDFRAGFHRHVAGNEGTLRGLEEFFCHRQVSRFPVHQVPGESGLKVNWRALR